MAETLARARVLRLIGERAVIQAVDQGWGRCHEPGGCGGYKALTSGRREYQIDNRLGARVGDLVEVSVAEGTVARLAGLIYLLPLVGVIAGAVVGGDGIGGIAAAIAGGVFGYLSARSLLRRENHGEPTVVRICGNHQEERS